jgi:hypothetical protein
MTGKTGWRFITSEKYHGGKEFLRDELGELILDDKGKPQKDKTQHGKDKVKHPHARNSKNGREVVISCSVEEGTHTLEEAHAHIKDNWDGEDVDEPV